MTSERGAREDLAVASSRSVAQVAAAAAAAWKPPPPPAWALPGQLPAASGARRGVDGEVPGTETTCSPRTDVWEAAAAAATWERQADSPVTTRAVDGVLAHESHAQHPVPTGTDPPQTSSPTPPRNFGLLHRPRTDAQLAAAVVYLWDTKTVAMSLMGQDFGDDLAAYFELVILEPAIEMVLSMASGRSRDQVFGGSAEPVILFEIMQRLNSSTVADRQMILYKAILYYFGGRFLKEGAPDELWAQALQVEDDVAMYYEIDLWEDFAHQAQDFCAATYGEQPVPDGEWLRLENEKYFTVQNQRFFFNAKGSIAIARAEYQKMYEDVAPGTLFGSLPQYHAGDDFERDLVVARFIHQFRISGTIPGFLVADSEAAKILKQQAENRAKMWEAGRATIEAMKTLVVLRGAFMSDIFTYGDVGGKTMRYYRGIDRSGGNDTVWYRNPMIMDLETFADYDAWKSKLDSYKKLKRGKGKREIPYETIQKDPQLQASDPAWSPGPLSPPQLKTLDTVAGNLLTAVDQLRTVLPETTWLNTSFKTLTVMQLMEFVTRVENAAEAVVNVLHWRGVAADCDRKKRSDSNSAKSASTDDSSGSTDYSPASAEEFKFRLKGQWTRNMFDEHKRGWAHYIEANQHQNITKPPKQNKKQTPGPEPESELKLAPRNIQVRVRVRVRVRARP
jgi:hypothetical protein